MRSRPTGTSLPLLAEQSRERFGDSVLLFEDRNHTASELGEQARHVAGGLRNLGVRPGDRVVVCMSNCPEVVITYHATWWIGALTTPVLFLLTETELRHVFADSGAVVAVTTPEFVPKVAAAAAGLGIRIVVVGEAQDEVVAFAELLDAAAAPRYDVDSTETAALLYTGGTTGRSKGVQLTHDAVSGAAWAATVGTVEPGLTVSVLPLPMAHAYGLMVATMALHSPHLTTTVLMRWFEASSFLSLVAREHVQTAAVVPTMLRLLAAQRLEDYDLSALRRLSSGSAPLAGELQTDLSRRLPWVDISEGYGCTETAALVSVSPYRHARAGSVGLPVGGCEVRLESPDGSDCPPLTDGEICVRAPWLMSGYWHAAQDTADVVRDGWFHTGDVGHLDADGYLWVIDRMKDLIIRDGFNVYPRDVEDVLLAHPDVVNCAVIGRPDRDHGEEVVAFVERRPGSQATADDVREFARRRLSAVKYPREVHLIDAIPLTSIGKLDRKALRM